VARFFWFTIGFVPFACSVSSFILDGRIVEALKTLEAAVVECKTRNIDTPEVGDALDVLAPYCRPECKLPAFAIT